MQYRNFGNTDLKASVVGFGVWTVSTSMWGVTDHAVRMDLLRRAHRLGVTFFDTADVYGDGAGETVLCEALGSHRNEIVIATKFGYDFYNFPGSQPGQRERPHDWSPAYIRHACEQSLLRLQTDSIDLYQMHNPRITDIHNDAIFETLDALRDEGKIRHYGVALGPALDMRQKQEGVAALLQRGVTSVQIIYNLVEQALGPDIFNAAKTSGGGVMCRVPHASGLLEGIYDSDTDFGPNDHRKFRVKDNDTRREWLDKGLQKIEKLGFLSRGTGRTLAQAALQFIWSEPSLACAVPNIYEGSQLEGFVAAAEAPPLTAAELETIRDLYAHDFYLEPEAVMA